MPNDRGTQAETTRPCHFFFFFSRATWPIGFEKSRAFVETSFFLSSVYPSRWWVSFQWWWWWHCFLVDGFLVRRRRDLVTPYKERSTTGFEKCSAGRKKISRSISLNVQQQRWCETQKGSVSPSVPAEYLPSPRTSAVSIGHGQQRYATDTLSTAAYLGHPIISPGSATPSRSSFKVTSASLFRLNQARITCSRPIVVVVITTHRRLGKRRKSLSRRLNLIDARSSLQVFFSKVYLQWPAAVK